MAKSIPAIVTPIVLKWARELDGHSIEDVALKFKIVPSRLAAWESGEARPTLPQAKRLARHYRIPFGYFYLPDEPRKRKRLNKVDYRTFGNTGVKDASLEFRRFLRNVEERRDIILELYQDIERTPCPLGLNLEGVVKEEVIAAQIRDFLSLSYEEQVKWRRSEVALASCIKKLELQDFLIFQAAKIRPEEMRGLSIAYETFPIIALNRKDEYGARLFTLIHELVHIATRTSGICNDIGNSSISGHKDELLCNKIAGMVLVPEVYLKKCPEVQQIQQYGLEETYVAHIAREFAVSRDVIVHRLYEVGIINREECFTTLKQYSQEYEIYKARKKTKGFISPTSDTATQLGRLYTSTILSAYRLGKLNARDTSGYLLNLRVKHFTKIEKWCIQ